MQTTHDPRRGRSRRRRFFFSFLPKQLNALSPPRTHCFFVVRGARRFEKRGRRAFSFFLSLFHAFQGRGVPFGSKTLRLPSRTGVPRAAASRSVSPVSRSRERRRKEAQRGTIDYFSTSMSSPPSPAAASAAPSAARPTASLPPPSSRLARMSLPAAWRPQRWRVEGAGGDRSTSAAAVSSQGVHQRRPGGSISSFPSAPLRRASSSASPLEPSQRTPLRQSQVSAWANACVGSNSSSSISSTLRGAVARAAPMSPSSPSF